MKNILFGIGCFIVGVVFASSADSVFAQVQSMIGKKVTGEYTVIVNGKTLADKGSVIDGKANVPLRSMSEALGADIKVEDRTINITTEEPAQTDKVVLLDGKYYTKYDLLNEKKKLEDNLVVVKANLEKEEAKRSEMESVTGVAKDIWLSGIKTLNDKVTSTTDKLAKIEEALKTFEVPSN